jgi:hypothetical protein
MSADGHGHYLRRAGTGTLDDGSVATWSVADGVRGRRWRWTIATDHGLRHAGLAELDQLGRFARLEFETGDGMLTLHPDADRSIAHGNVVRVVGVEPLAFAWSDDEALAIEDDPFGSAVLGWRGSGWVIGVDLGVGRENGRSVPALELDARGVPRLRGDREWPLEV